MAPSKTRWVVCGLLFLATTINYVDRQVLSLLAPDLQKEIGWNELQYGYIVTAFQAAYAIGQAFVGRFIDRVGTRLGFTYIVLVWSIAAAAHSLAASVLGFVLMRFLLGLGEAGNFPASVKTVAEWFPRKERALATGIFNSGSNIGAFLVPLLIPFVVAAWGWRAAFIITGATGFVWVLFWLALKERPASLAAEQDTPSRPLSWRTLVSLRSVWAYAIGKFLTDPVWWFYLYWLPKFLHDRFGLTLEAIGLPLITIYVAADVGSIGGGWLSAFLLGRGWSVNRARKFSLLVCAIAVVPVFFVSSASNLWTAVAFMSLATAAHQGWSANLYTLTSDIFPDRAVGSVMGAGGMLGAFGGMLAAAATGALLHLTGSYVPLFIAASSMYLIALLILHILVPRIEPIPVEKLGL